MSTTCKGEVFIHDLADVQSRIIGAGTKVWQFSLVMEGANIGNDCNICAHVLIENDVVLGDRVTVKSGVQLWDGVELQSDVFIGPNVTFTNDLFPRSKKHPSIFEETLIENGASVGANATILAGVKVGRFAMVGAGSVVTHSVPAYAIVVGNPARIKGYVDLKTKIPTESNQETNLSQGCLLSRVQGVRIFTLPVVDDMRGSLTFAEIGQCLPFEPKRYFLVYNVNSNEIRGEHAHRKLHQFLVCVNGSCAVVVDDGENREEYLLNHPGKGIHISPMVWGIQYKYSADAVLMVLASEKYDASEYIRDYNEFLSLKQKS